MTDNHWSYTLNRSLRELLAKRSIHHLATRPRRPRTNGKVERFHQTMAREWAATALLDTGPEPWHTGFATTTGADRTARSAAYPRSAVFTTSVGTTTRAPPRVLKRARVESWIHGVTP